LALFALGLLSMSNADFGIHFVVVRRGTSRELWITAGPRKEAVANVLRHFSQGHLAELSDRRISAEEAFHLKLKNGEARVFDQPSSNRGQGLR
jgi:hypothetical protein